MPLRIFPGRCVLLVRLRFSASRALGNGAPAAAAGTGAGATGALAGARNPDVAAFAATSVRRRSSVCVACTMCGTAATSAAAGRRPLRLKNASCHAATMPRSFTSADEGMTAVRDVFAPVRPLCVGVQRWGGGNGAARKSARNAACQLPPGHAHAAQSCVKGGAR